MQKKWKERLSGEPAQQKTLRHATAHLRLWPGIVAAILLLLAKFIVPIVIPDALPFAMFGGLL